MWRWTIDLDAAASTSANSTTKEWSSPASTTGWPVPARRHHAQSSVRRAAAWSATTWNRGSTEEHTSDNDARRADPGEAVFVPAGPGADELAGWYLSYVYDPVRNGSDLVILDASDFTGKPVARVRLPQRVPHGFHGNWITD